ncbi:MAG: acyl-CoA dehydrogenase family protein [Dehalococcoidales bacterium]|nr:acyl-CoA dehydrogenase family protein [Dehalococcoidales bacterium]
MAVEETGKLDALRQEIRAFLRKNLPKGWGTPEYVAPERGSKEAHELGKQWQKKLYDAGYTGFGVPKEYGGIERSREEMAVIREELTHTGAPPLAGSLGPSIVLPTLLRYGKEWQKKRFIPKILSGEESWCECFSEPNAGSDLANIQKTGVRDGDEWVVNGQSVWTSGAKFADWGVAPVRTDLKAPRHRNLSYFVFDCKSPGFEVRPLRQMTGDSEFGETFFDNMRIPHENMVGEEGKGWYVAMATLEAERGGGFQFLAPSRRIELTSLGGVDNFVELAKNTKRRGKVVWEDPVFRQRIAQFAIENEAMRYSRERMRVKAQKKQTTGNEQSISSIFSREKNQRQANMVAEIMGANIQFMKGDKRALDDGSWAYTFLRTRGNTIETGTTEINRGIIAERMLGLPKSRA